MIYTKTANFPYPILSNDSDDYVDAIFNLDLEIIENTTEFIIKVNSEISSMFIVNILKEKRAKMMLVIKSKYNQFFEIKNYLEDEIRIDKKKVMLTNKSLMQIVIQANEDIVFDKNDDIDEFYKEFKSKIIVSKGNVLALSNVSIYDGSQKFPMDLFHKVLDETLDTDFKVHLDEEVIIIKYKDKEMMFENVGNRGLKGYVNPYLYIGLMQALTSFYNTYLNLKSDSPVLELDNIKDERCSMSTRNAKIFDLLTKKGIEEFELEDIDFVIEKISEKMLRKYAKQVIEEARYGD